MSRRLKMKREADAKVMVDIGQDLAARARFDPKAAERAKPALVESKVGAVTWGLWPSSRFPSPLIEPDLRSYRIRLSGWLHCEAHGGAFSGKRSRRRRPSL